MTEYRKQEPPNSVQIELTEGCNLRCSFCGLNGIRGPQQHEYNFMTPETAVVVASRIARSPGWRPRIEFAMRGEPTLNRARAEIVGAFRAAMPGASLMMTSNGGGLLGRPGPYDNVAALFAAGLNALCLDDYRDANLVPRIREALSGAPWEVLDYPECGSRGSPHRKRRPSERQVIVIADISETKPGNHSLTMLNNHCGAGAPPNQRMQGRRCARPFREMVVHWNGNVPLCCNDWRGHYKIGNLALYDTADELWQHERYGAARRLLYHGQRTVGPCAGCDAYSYRTGLLPDRMGKESLPEPTAEDERLAQEASAGRTWTLPVLRPWESAGQCSLPEEALE